MFSPEYIKYIHSAEWSVRRTRALRLADYHCQVCHASNWLQVHHNNYSRLGKEIDADLIVLCAPCHYWITWMIRIRRWLAKPAHAR